MEEKKELSALEKLDNYMLNNRILKSKVVLLNKKFFKKINDEIANKSADEIIVSKGINPKYEHLKVTCYRTSFGITLNFLISNKQKEDFLFFDNIQHLIYYLEN